MPSEAEFAPPFVADDQPAPTEGASRYPVNLRYYTLSDPYIGSRDDITDAVGERSRAYGHLRALNAERDDARNSGRPVYASGGYTGTNRSTENIFSFDFDFIALPALTDPETISGESFRNGHSISVYAPNATVALRIAKGCLPPLGDGFAYFEQLNRYIRQIWTRPAPGQTGHPVGPGSP